MNEPTRIYSGDTVTWVETLSGYPASDGWSLTYYFKQAAETPVPIPATGSGDTYSVLIGASTSGLMNPGTYSWTSRVSKGEVVQTIGFGTMAVTPDPTRAYDARSHAEKGLEAVTAALEGRLSDPVTEYEVDGLKVKHMSHKELLELRTLYSAMVRRGLGKPGIRAINQSSVFRVRG